VRGLGALASADRFCTGFEEQRQYFRAVTRSVEHVSLAERRRRFQEHWATIWPNELPPDGRPRQLRVAHRSPVNPRRSQF
jgi:hypothetical protein